MNKVQELLQQEISRKDFLRYIGLALLGMVGVTAMLQNLTNTLSTSGKTEKKSDSGYGMSPYGR